MTDQRTLTVLRKLIVDTVNADPSLPFGHLDDEVAERVAAAVLAQFEGVESAEVTTEWGVRWPDDGVELVATESIARTGVLGHEATIYGAVLVSRPVGPWIEVAG